MFDQPAELFVATSIGAKAAIIKYRRFDPFPDALRHAVEVMGLAKFPGTVIEFADQRLNSRDIADRYAALTPNK